MAQNPVDTIGVSGAIVPHDSGDTYPTHYAKYGKGGYFTVQTLAELLDTPVSRLEEGSLAYLRDENSFYLYRNNEWEKIDILDAVTPSSVSKEIVKPEELPDFLQSIDRGSKYIIYVDPNHANSSDSKDNTGNSPLRPFKTIERACLQAARKSFKENEAGNVVPNDFTERVTVYLAPATYYVNNGKGGVDYDLDFNKRQDAAQLILANRGWLIDTAYESVGIDAFIDSSTSDAEERHRLKSACRRDLIIYVTALANDIAVGGSYETVKAANAIRPNGTFIEAYNTQTIRNYATLALTSIRDNIQDYVIKNTADTVGGVKVIGITADSNSANPCASLSLEVGTLLNGIINTLDPNNSVPSLSEASRGLYQMAFPEQGEPTPNNLQSFNNSESAGIILPRGISIVGADLRKVIIRPKYVPSKTGPERAAIFRMTGGNFFSGFTVRDNEDIKESHHKLSAFEFCRNDDLQLYYDNVASVFDDNKQFNLLFDSSNLIFFNTEWLAKQISNIPTATSEELDYKTDFINFVRLFIISISQDLRFQSSDKFKQAVIRFKTAYIDSLDDVADKEQSIQAYTGYFEELYKSMVEAISNRANVAEGGFIDNSIPVDKTSPTNPCQDIQAIIYNFYSLFPVILGETTEGAVFPISDRFGANDVEPAISENTIVGDLNADVNTVQGASPYIFSATLRSEYGMCGIDGDGSVVSGFKSYLAAQFTVISIQKDGSAFAQINDAGEVANKRYKGTLSSDNTGENPLGDWRQFGYRVTNEAYAQLVSCFCIGPAVHYWCDSGSEFSITNSTSNFGDVSLLSKGYVGQNRSDGAYPQDRDYKVIGVKPPLALSASPSAARKINLGTVSSLSFVDSPGILQYIGGLSNNSSSVTGSIILEAAYDPFAIEPYSVINGDQVYVSLPVGSGDDGEITFLELKAEVGSVSNNQRINVEFPAGSWPNPQVAESDANYNTTLGRYQILLGSSLYIKRLSDTRSPEDKVHKLVVEKPASGSRGKPIENFILRAKAGPTQTQFPFSKDNVWYIAKSERTADEDVYLLTMLNAYVDDEGRSELNSGYYPTLDLNYDPELQADSIVLNPTSSSTYKSTVAILTHLGITGAALSSALALNTGNNSITEKDVEFNKPSTIRCGGQTWEYVGYYNYDTALPQQQQFQIGAGMTEEEKIIKRLSKLQNSTFGGRIYATGLDEEGNSYIGTKVTNTKTGEETDTRLIGSEDSLTKSYTKLNIVTALNLITGSTLTMAGGSTLKLDPGTVLRLPGYDGDIIDAKASYIKTARGADLINPGFSQPASFEETINEYNLQRTNNGFSYVTPAALAEWRKAKNIVSQRSGTTKVYIGPWYGINPVSYSSAYLKLYWPEPQFPSVPISDNPGYEFKPFATLEDAASWTRAVLAPSERAELWIAPGMYYIGARFNCDVTIKGAYGSNIFGDPNDEKQSVIFYKRISVGLRRVSSGAYRLRSIETVGSLELYGPGNSEISRVFFMSPEDAYKINYRINNNEADFPTNKSPAQLLLESAVNARRRNIYTPSLLEYLDSSNINGLETCYDNGNLRLIHKNEGSLSVSQCAIYGQSTSSDPWGVTPSCYFLLVNSTLTLNGCSFRGTSRLTVPRNVTNTVGTTYVVINPDESRGFSNWMYPSGATGAYDGNNGAPYYTLYGSTRSFIEAAGRCNINLVTDTNTVDNAPDANFNDDRNNLRLERMHFDYVNFSSSNYGIGRLGIRGTAADLVANPAVLETTFQNEFDARGPFVRTFMTLRWVNTQVTFDGFNYNGDRVSTPTYIGGWKGEFSYLFLRMGGDLNQLTVAVQRPYGWLSYNSGTGQSMSNNSTLPSRSVWHRAGFDPSHSAEPNRSANHTNVYATYFSTPTVSFNASRIEDNPNFEGLQGTLLLSNLLPHVLQIWQIGPPEAWNGVWEADWDRPVYDLFADTATTPTSPPRYIFAIILYNFSVSSSISI